MHTFLGLFGVSAALCPHVSTMWRQMHMPDRMDCRRHLTGGALGVGFFRQCSNGQSVACSFIVGMRQVMQMCLPDST